MMNFNGQQTRVFGRANNRRALSIFRAIRPTGASALFAKLREQTLKKWGNHGLASPNWQDNLKDVPTSSLVPDLPSTTQLKTLSQRNTYSTRDETIQRNLGLSPLSIQQLPPRTGIASSPAQRAAGDPGGLGGVVGSQEWVEDQDWQVTLAQLVGSGLTQEQLTACSFNNIRSLIGGNGDAVWKNEMTYIIQRMCVEGYLHGVDLVRELQTYSGGFPINEIPDSGDLLGLGGAGELNICSRFRGMDDASKLSIIYHEAGHELLNVGHTGWGLMTYNWFFADDWVHDNYNGLIDELFGLNPNVSPESENGPRLTADQVNNMIQANPGWYPGITGVVGGPTGTNTTTNIQINPPTVTPWNASMGGLLSMGGGSGAPSTPDEGTKTPVAGTLPDIAAVQSFAAGLQDAMSRASPTLQGLSGALMRYRSG